MSNEINHDLPQRIKTWLEKQGQAMEMRVAKAFRESGFSVSQYDCFIDQETEIVRQVDVVASLSRNIDNCLVTVKLVVECKYLKHPWVILVNPRKTDKYVFFARILQNKSPLDWRNFPTLQGRLVARIVLSLEQRQLLTIFSIERAGYSVLDALLKGDDKGDDTGRPKPMQQPEPKPKESAFEAALQVSKSIEAHDVENEEIFKNTYQTGDINLLLNVAFPVIVINGKLFESLLGDNNEIQVSEVKQGFVLLPYRHKENRSTVQVPLSPIIIVTEQYLPSFIPDIRQALECILEQKDAIIELINYERSKIKPTVTDDF